MSQPMNGKSAELAARDEGMKEIRSAFDKICDNYGRKLNRKPTVAELESILQGALEDLESEPSLIRQEDRDSGCLFEKGGSRETGYSCMADKPCTCRIPSFEAAMVIALEIVKGNRQCRFISGEMHVKIDGETVSLMEEQMLSDGTRILGRSFTFDNGNEAVEAVAKILWESAKL